MRAKTTAKIKEIARKNAGRAFWVGVGVMATHYYHLHQK